MPRSLGHVTVAQSPSASVGQDAYTSHSRRKLLWPNQPNTAWMTLVAYVVVLAVALPYWATVGEPLRLSTTP